MLSESTIRALSGFGPTYDEMISSPDTIICLYHAVSDVEVFYRGRKYVCTYHADYDMPKAIYLRSVLVPSSGKFFYSSSVIDRPVGNRYPIDWAWV